MLQQPQLQEPQVMKVRQFALKDSKIQMIQDFIQCQQIICCLYLIILAGCFQILTVQRVEFSTSSIPNFHLSGTAPGSSTLQRFEASRSASDSGEKETDSGEKKHKKDKKDKQEKKEKPMKKPAARSQKQKKSKGDTGDDDEEIEEDEGHNNPFLEKRKRDDDEDDEPPSEGGAGDGLDVRSRKGRGSAKKPAAKDTRKKSGGEKKKKSKKSKKHGEDESSESSEKNAEAMRELELSIEKAQKAEEFAHSKIDITTFPAEGSQDRSELFHCFQVEANTLLEPQDLNAMLEDFASRPLESLEIHKAPNNFQNCIISKLSSLASQWFKLVWNFARYLFRMSAFLKFHRPDFADKYLKHIWIFALTMSGTIAGCGHCWSKSQHWRG